MNPTVTWRCNNPKCDYEHVGEFFGPTHVPDTDCPKCGWHDSVVEVSAKVVIPPSFPPYFD
jgi:hypothetical protein